MTDQGASQPGGAAGWKKDPTGRHFGRYWDGSSWTDHVVNAEKVTSTDPYQPAPDPSIFPEGPPPTVPPPAPAPTDRGPVPTAPGWTPESSGKRAKDGGVKVWKIALGVMLGLFAFMAVCVAVIANGANEAVKEIESDLADGTLDNTSPPATAPAPSTVYKVGDTAKTGDFEVTVYGFKNSQTTTNQFDKPAAGNRYVSVDVQIANKGSRQETFSSFIGFHLVDSANRQYDLKITTVEPKAPEGQIPAGGAIRGLAVFEVPEDTTGMRLRVQGNFTASGAFFALA
jgi:hypothetical protein